MEATRPITFGQGYSSAGGNGGSGAANTTQGFGGPGGGSSDHAANIYYLARLVSDAVGTPGSGILGGRGGGAYCRVEHYNYLQLVLMQLAMAMVAGGACITTTSTSGVNAHWW